jgi:homoserine kinase type II
MSVYTELNPEEFTQLLSHYDLGTLVSFQGVAAGIENTNYKITLNKAEIETDYFLTIFEQTSLSELNFFVPLLAHLKSNDCHVAGPKAQISGRYVLTVKDKPAAIFDCLSGYHVENITPQECFTIGAELAKVHLAAEDFTAVHQNPRGFYWLQKQINNNRLCVDSDNQEILKSTLLELQDSWALWQTQDLPKGFIHGDLFADNCLFHDSKTVGGVIDFYAGGNDYWVYDLAICVLAWCAEDKQLSNKRQQQLVKGYETIRTLNAQEQKALPNFIQLATLRFWVSRLIAQEASLGAALTTSKNPDEMKAILLSLN